jgi:hypothetical protein
MGFCTGMMRNQLFTMVDSIVHDLLASMHALRSGDDAAGQLAAAHQRHGDDAKLRAGLIGCAYR